jgi:crotonobetainyl-CoA:carnitine CoA-transferase CaiB-like acyl-CoA transferase
MAYELLKGTRVLDLTMVFAGPVSSRILASLGAEVIKIESAVRPDVFTRGNVYPENDPGTEPWNRGSLFHSLNAGKLGITLNLGTEKGRDLFKRLVKISDVVMENYSPRVMENWGLGYAELKKIKPDIIMASMSGLGHTGPLKDFYMYVPGMEGMSGLTHMTGYTDEPPMLSGFSYGDWTSGGTSAAAILTALYHKKSTGQGQFIDLAGREALIANVGNIIMDYTLNKRVENRMGNDQPYAAPHGCYRCKGEDNWVNIAVENDEQWTGFCKLIGNPDWCKSEKFGNSLNRWQNRADLDKLVEEWTLKQDKFEIMASFQKAGVPAGAVLNMKEVNLNSQLIERGFFNVIDHGEGIGERPIPTQLPAKYNNKDSFIPARAPKFGQDNKYVFGKLLGISNEELSTLEAEKIIGGAPSFPPGRPTRLNLIEAQGAGQIDANYLNELREKYKKDIGTKGTAKSDPK